jgi:hypothetical protein
VNYLVYLGLRAYGFDDVAHMLARRSVRLFMYEWNLRGHCHENYNAITGEADDVPVSTSPGSNGSDRFYPWGALLPLMGIEELFDIEMEEGVRFGCRFLEAEARISRIPYAESTYDITASSERTVARRDDRQFYFSDPGTNVRNYEAVGETVRFSVSGEGKTTFKIREFVPSSEVIIRHEGRDVCHMHSNDQGSVTFDLDISPSYTVVVVTGKPGI